MMRRFTHYLLLSASCFFVGGCEDEEVASPPKPAFDVSKNNVVVGEEIIFTVDPVNADAVSLLPYGLGGNDAGVAVQFTEGAAEVPFTYTRTGTFQAVVVANNHTGDGESIVNVESDPITITVTSSENAISDFRFIRIEEKETAFEVVTVSSETDIDEDANTITVTVPYGTDVENLTAAFTASGSTTVKVGGVAQTSEETVNDFSSPVVYQVTAHDGTVAEYTVTVIVTPVETITAIKSITPIAVSEDADEKELGASVDNANSIIVVYDELGTTSAQFDSVRIGYELEGDFAVLNYGGEQMDQDSLLDLRTAKEFEVVGQDETVQTFTVYATDAPKLALSFPALIPDPADGVEPDGFNINISVLKGTDVSAIVTSASTTDPTGVTATVTKVNDEAFVNGVTAVDYSEPVEFELTVVDSRIPVNYTVIYTVTVTEVP